MRVNLETRGTQCRHIGLLFRRCDLFAMNALDPKASRMLDEQVDTATGQHGNVLRTVCIWMPSRSITRQS